MDELHQMTKIILRSLGTGLIDPRIFAAVPDTRVLRQEIAENITAAAKGSFRIRNTSPGNPPRIRTGALQRSVDFFFRGDELLLQSTDYGFFLEAQGYNWIGNAIRQGLRRPTRRTQRYFERGGTIRNIGRVIDTDQDVEDFLQITFAVELWPGDASVLVRDGRKRRITPDRAYREALGLQRSTRGVRRGRESQIANLLSLAAYGFVGQRVLPPQYRQFLRYGAASARGGLGQAVAQDIRQRGNIRAFIDPAFPTDPDVARALRLGRSARSNVRRVGRGRRRR